MTFMKVLQQDVHAAVAAQSCHSKCPRRHGRDGLGVPQLCCQRTVEHGSAHQSHSTDQAKSTSEAPATGPT